jgi:NRPS condensation-like uncharacterized protein
MARRAVEWLMPSIPLSLLDELYLNLDRDTEPWTVHYELRLGVHLDADRLSAAIAQAADLHPLARSRLAPWRLQDRGYDWEIADRLDDVPLRIAECADEAALGAERERLFCTSPSLMSAPPFNIVLARGPAGDSVMLNLHHAAGDGISAARLLLSITRAYAGEPDPVPPLDPLAVHDVRALAAARSAREVSARRRAMLTASWRPVVQPARVARDGGDDRPAYGFECFALSVAESRRLFARHPKTATVNDVLLAALAIAIGRWNAEHGRRASPIALSMPVNLRPPEWQHEIFSNFASWVTVWVRPQRGEELNSVVSRVAQRTGAIKRDRLGGMAVDMLSVTSRLMIAAKRWFAHMKVFTAAAVVDTASLSNLGALDPLPALFGGPEVALWFSPPSQMPLGVGVGAVTLRDRLYVTMRYRHAQFDRGAARRFAELYRQILAGTG